MQERAGRLSQPARRLSAPSLRVCRCTSFQVEGFEVQAMPGRSGEGVAALRRAARTPQRAAHRTPQPKSLFIYEPLVQPAVSSVAFERPNLRRAALRADSEATVATRTVRPGRGRTGARQRRRTGRARRRSARGPCPATRSDVSRAEDAAVAVVACRDSRASSFEEGPPCLNHRSSRRFRLAPARQHQSEPAGRGAVPGAALQRD